MLLGSRNAQYVFTTQTEKNSTHSRILQCHIRLKRLLRFSANFTNISGAEIHENKPSDVTVCHYRMASKI